jgi:predicted RNase H-like HicB family nuclease
MTAKYRIDLVWSEADRAWFADLPDLQSCSAFGNMPVEAQTEVELAMGAWLDVAREDGLPIPKPRYRAAKRAAV